MKDAKKYTQHDGEISRLRRENSELRDRLKETERAISQAEEEAGRLEKELADPETWKDPDAAAGITRRYNALKTETERLYEQYEEIEDELQG